jgi:hypothetical protein
MIGAKRLMFALLAAASLIASSGCCCYNGGCGCGGGGCGGGCCGCGLFHHWFCNDYPDDYRGGGSYWCDCGCGELYCGDWHSSPPHDDPCDNCGNWTGCGDEPLPAYQLPPRMQGDPGKPYDSTPQPNPPTPPRTPVTRNGNYYEARQASYNAPARCATCGE